MLLAPRTTDRAALGRAWGSMKRCLPMANNGHVIAVASAKPLAEEPRLKTWLLPALAVLVPLACLPELGNNFELPKLVLLRVGLGITLLGLATGAVAGLGFPRAPAALVALLYLGI